ncbi:MAG: class GN sortase [Xanthomonadales bacterium]|nr:class GN sortase [Xanthomonadales bacterium]
MNRRTLIRCLSGMALALAFGLAASASWIHVKAALAQVLLERAWIASDHGSKPVPPWPWADIAPLARLQIPRLGTDLIVLDNDSGQALAFGPGWTPHSAAPATYGITIISAHRDTQFSVLQQLKLGDRIEVNGAAGQRAYVVSNMQVLDSRRARLPNAHAGDALLLVTCYPFDAIVPGGPLRYVVEADPVNHDI